jgi:release factor glutamine methyltransferase
MSIAELLQQAAVRLAEVSDSPRLDAELLLCRVLECERSYLFTWPEREPERGQSAAFEELLARREQGEPVAHILGQREFWSLDLAVSPDTLIPRPETELLVEAALARIPLDAEWEIADLGTGSGAIALAIASERPGCRVVAVERSAGALAVAQKNASRLGISNVEFLAGDWFEPLAGRQFQMIVSNPPYIPADDPHLQQGDVRFEPATALVSGDDGLNDIRHLITKAKNFLVSPGWLLLEHGHDQGEAVITLLQAAGYQDIENHRDLLGNDRVAMGAISA